MNGCIAREIQKLTRASFSLLTSLLFLVCCNYLVHPRHPLHPFLADPLLTCKFTCSPCLLPSKLRCSNIPPCASHPFFSVLAIHVLSDRCGLHVCGPHHGPRNICYAPMRQLSAEQVLLVLTSRNIRKPYYVCTEPSSQAVQTSIANSALRLIRAGLFLHRWISCGGIFTAPKRHELFGAECLFCGTSTIKCSPSTAW